MKRLFALAVAALVHSTASASAAPPKLLVVISVDQFSADLFDEYRGQFTGGLARIASGTAYRNGYQGHAATETCPGHSTMLTGNRPARTGIIANAWLDQSISRQDKNVYCAEDERAPGTTSLKYAVSPEHLKVPTLGELMKARWPESRNVAVAGKDRAAVMMSGHKADQRWYWNGEAFVTDLDGRATPASVAAANIAVAAKIAAAQPALDPTPFCAPMARPIPLEGREPVGNGTFARSAGDAAAFRTSPAYDGAVLALAAALTNELQLGRGIRPDLLSIGLSATDYVGHAFGSGGQEMCLQLNSLDRDLGDFLRFLDSTRVDYAVVLTADHGGLDIPERLNLEGVADAARVDPGLSTKAVGESVAAKLKLNGPVLEGGVAGDVYLDQSLSGPQRASALAAAVAAYRAFPQVEAVFTKAQILASAVPAGDVSKWGLIERVRASFDPLRSGDIYVVLKRNVMPIAKPTATYIATHGSPWDYDRRVPILWWRANMPTANREEAIETIDIMPTLAAMIGLPLGVGAVDGKCLGAVSGVACPQR